MGRNDFIEKVLGGLFALVSIVGAVAEMILNDFSAASIAGGVKDIFATLVVVILFLAVAKDIIPKFKFEDKLKVALDTWQNENANMIIRDPITDIEHKGSEPSCYSLNLKTDVVDFYKDSSTTKSKGLFLRMPLLTRDNYSKEGVEIKFYLNKSTFFSNIPKGEDTPEKYAKLIDLFKGLINSKHHELAEADGKDREITVTLKKPIKSNADIAELVAIINTMYTAYLVSANLGE